MCRERESFQGNHAGSKTAVNQAPFQFAVWCTGPRVDVNEDDDSDTGSNDGISGPVPSQPIQSSSAGNDPATDANESDLPHSEPSPTPPLSEVVEDTTDQCNLAETHTKPRDLTVSAQLNGQNIKLLVDKGAGA